MSEIKAVVVVRDIAPPVGQMIVVGEVPGPWPSVEAAVSEALDDGQSFRVVDDVLYAAESAEERPRRNAAAVSLGRRGGKAGTGAAKRRDVDYRALGRAGAAARKLLKRDKV